jgi:hypothetical protein
MFLRMITAKALSGKTLAADRVRDSDVSDLSELMTAEAAPMIVIYTDDQVAEYDAKELFNPKGHILLTVQISIAGATQGEIGPDNQVVATAAGDEAPSRFYVPSTSSGLEAMIDIIEAQIKAALTDKDSVWAEIWADYVTKYRRSQSFRGASDQQGTRFAVRQFNIEVEVRSEPTPGRGVTPTYARILAALKDDADETYADLVPLLTAVMVGKPLQPFELEARQAGISMATRAIMGEQPLPGAAPGQAVSDIIVDPMGLSATDTEAVPAGSKS